MVDIMKRIILTSYFWLMFLTVTVISIILLPLYLFVQIIFFSQQLDVAVRRGICIYGWVLVELVPFLAPVQLELRAGELPRPAIFVPNHNSAIDPYLFGLLETDVCFVTSWAFRIPVYGLFMRLAKYINADDGWETVHRQSQEVLQKGASLIIWPEGHRSRNGQMGRFKNGAFALAVETGYPLVPVCIVGSGKFLSPGKRLVTPSQIKLIMLNPLQPDSHNDQQQEIIRLRNAAQEAIENTLEELNLDAVNPGNFDD